MIPLLVLAALSIAVIATGAVLHFAVPESDIPMTLIGIAVATLVPAIVSMAKELTKAQQDAEEQRRKASREQQRADRLLEETTALRRQNKP